MRSRVLLVTLVLALACVAVPPPGPRPPPYERALARYTVDRRTYDLFDPIAYATATYQAAPFREAKIEATRSFLTLSEAEDRALVDSERAEQSAYHAVFMALWTSDPSWNDLHSKDSIWQVRLVAPNGAVEPIDVIRETNADRNVRTLYPYITSFDVAYRLRFPRVLPDGRPLAEDGGTLTLELTSGAGHVRLPWKLAAADVAPGPGPAPPVLPDAASIP